MKVQKHFHFPNLVAPAVALLGILFAVPAQAGTFAIEPTRLTFGVMSSGDVVITNVGQTPLRLSLKAYEWSQRGGEAEHLLPTNDVAYFPQLFDLPPGASQRVRVGILRSPESQEQAYRLIVSELPDAAPGTAPGSLGIHFLSRVDIPLLLTPTGIPGSSPGLGELATHGDAVDLHLLNKGTSHIEESRVSLIVLDKAHHVLWQTTTNAFYVLAHSDLDVRCAVPQHFLRKARTMTAVWHVGPSVMSRTYAPR